PAFLRASPAGGRRRFLAPPNHHVPLGSPTHPEVRSRCGWNRKRCPGCRSGGDDPFRKDVPTVSANAGCEVHAELRWPFGPLCLLERGRLRTRVDAAMCAALHPGSPATLPRASLRWSVLWPCGPKDSPLAFPFVFNALNGEEAFFALVLPVGW